MNEYIEIYPNSNNLQYETGYQVGFEDGIESFRTKFEEMKELFDSRLADRDRYIVHLELKNESLQEVLHGMAMKVEKLEEHE